jgi:hypothetical protein
MYLNNTYVIKSDYTSKVALQIKIKNEIAVCVGVLMRITYPFVQTWDVSHRVE